MELVYEQSVSNGKIKVRPELRYMTESASTTFYLGVYNNNIYYRFVGY